MAAACCSCCQLQHLCPRVAAPRGGAVLDAPLAAAVAAAAEPCLLHLAAWAAAVVAAVAELPHLQLHWVLAATAVAVAAVAGRGQALQVARPLPLSWVLRRQRAAQPPAAVLLAACAATAGVHAASLPARRC